MTKFIKKNPIQQAYVEKIFFENLGEIFTSVAVVTQVSVLTGLHQAEEGCGALGWLARGVSQRWEKSGAEGHCIWTSDSSIKGLTNNWNDKY